MIALKIGDLVSLKTIQLPTGGDKIVPKDYSGKEKVTKKPFEIIGKTRYLSGTNVIPAYLIMVPDSYVGWMISNFHTSFCDSPKKALGKKFREINSAFI